MCAGLVPNQELLALFDCKLSLTDFKLQRELLELCDADLEVFLLRRSRFDHWPCFYRLWRRWFEPDTASPQQQSGASDTKYFSVFDCRWKYRFYSNRHWFRIHANFCYQLEWQYESYYLCQYYAANNSGACERLVNDGIC